MPREEGGSRTSCLLLPARAGECMDAIFNLQRTGTLSLQQNAEFLIKNLRGLIETSTKYRERNKIKQNPSAQDALINQNSKTQKEKEI